MQTMQMYILYKNSEPFCAYKNEEDAKYDAHEQFGLYISKSKENWQSTRLEIKRKQVQEISSEYCLVDNKRVIIYQ